jgi:rod shape-determining protein MreC
VSPNRARLVAAVALVGQLAILAAQTPDRSGRATNLLAGLALRAVAPFASAVANAGEQLGAARAGLRGRAELARDNERLRAELVELRRERLRLAALEEEVDALARGLELAGESRFDLRAARVAYLDARSALRTVLLRVGERGARRDQAVVAEAGVVGRVVDARGPWAKVQLITDRAAAVSVQLERTRRQGVAHGSGPAELEIDYLPRQVAVQIGERVLTAGIDGVFPRGLPVGVVVAVETADELFHRVRVRPFVDFSQLSLLYLLDGVDTPPRELRDAGALR